LFFSTLPLRNLFFVNACFLPFLNGCIGGTLLFVYDNLPSVDTLYVLPFYLINLTKDIQLAPFKSQIQQPGSLHFDLRK